LYLEGAGWDTLEKKLVESKPNELYLEAPVI
jgi:dynein heavy chain